MQKGWKYLQKNRQRTIIQKYTKRKYLQPNNKKISSSIKNRTKDLHRYSTKEDILKANKHMRSCSTLYVVRELHIKTRCHYKSIRIVKTPSIDNIKCQQWCGATETLIHYLWKCETVQLLRKKFLTKLNYSDHMIQQLCSLVFIQKSWNLCPHKNLHTCL